MKIKTSITLSKELLQWIDARIEPQQRSRSEFIEAAVRAFLAHADRASLQAREAALLRKHAAALNAEMADVLEYQVLPSR
jgi:metal-responsive CopG/Arc/MetJ family transcriptional regulator